MRFSLPLLFACLAAVSASDTPQSCQVERLGSSENFRTVGDACPSDKECLLEGKDEGYDEMSDILDGKCVDKKCAGSNNSDGQGNGQSRGTDRVTICHRTCSAKNPWVRITTDDDAWNDAGCGHQQHNIEDECSNKSPWKEWGTNHQDYLIKWHGTRDEVAANLTNANAEREYWKRWERACPYALAKKGPNMCCDWAAGECCGENPFSTAAATAVEAVQYDVKQGLCTVAESSSGSTSGSSEDSSAGSSDDDGKIKLGGDLTSSDKVQECKDRCALYEGATGCEVHKWGGTQGCYAYTKPIVGAEGSGQFACLIGPAESCPKKLKDLAFASEPEDGTCDFANGGDPLQDAKKLAGGDYGTPEKFAECLEMCACVEGVTGCEAINGKASRGCYAHTRPVSKGKGWGGDKMKCFPLPIPLSEQLKIMADGVDQCPEKKVQYKEPEQGNCKLYYGKKREENAIKLSDGNFNTAELQQACLDMCSCVEGVSGCEVIVNTKHKGCYAYTVPVLGGRGNGGDHRCFVGPTQGVCQGPTAKFSGDPHFTTFDDLQYDCQGHGEFVLSKSINGVFEMHGRFERGTGSFGKSATVTKALALKVAPDVPKIEVNSDLSNGCTLQHLVDGTKVNPFVRFNSTTSVEVLALGRALVYNFPKQETRIEIMSKKSDVFGCVLSVNTCLTPEKLGGADNIRGLLGTPDGNKKDEWHEEDGSPVEMPSNGKKGKPESRASYAYCVDNWCVTDASKSMFSYGSDIFDKYNECESYFDEESFTKLINNIPPDVRAACKGDEACEFDGAVGGLEDAKNEKEVNEALDHVDLETDEDPNAKVEIYKTVKQGQSLCTENANEIEFGPANTLVTYCYKIRNTGGVPLTEVKVVDKETSFEDFVDGTLEIDGEAFLTNFNSITADLSSYAVVTTAEGATDKDDAGVIMGCGLAKGKTGSTICPSADGNSVKVLPVVGPANLPSGEDILYDLEFGTNANKPTVSFKVNNPFESNADVYVRHDKPNGGGGGDYQCDVKPATPWCSPTEDRFEAACMPGSMHQETLVSVYFVSTDQALGSGGAEVEKCCHEDPSSIAEPVVQYTFMVRCGCPSDDLLDN